MERNTIFVFSITLLCKVFLFVQKCGKYEIFALGENVHVCENFVLTLMGGSMKKRESSGKQSIYIAMPVGFPQCSIYADCIVEEAAGPLHPEPSSSLVYRHIQ